MRLKRSITAMAASAALAAGLIAVPASTATALGTATKVCTGGAIITGLSTSSLASTATESGNCGLVSARAYYTHVGGATWSPWASAQTYAYQQIKNTTRGQHKADKASTFTT